MEKELNITIKPNGEMSIETINIKGENACTKVIDSVLVGIGGSDAAFDVKKTDDFWLDDRRVYTDLR